MVYNIIYIIGDYVFKIVFRSISPQCRKRFRIGDTFFKLACTDHSASIVHTRHLTETAAAVIYYDYYYGFIFVVEVQKSVHTATQNVALH